jgi:para-aminobenzoate synthetase component 1
MESAVKNMNLLGKKKTPFFFLIDFEMKKPLVIPLSEIDRSVIKYDLNYKSKTENKGSQIKLRSKPVDIEEYKTAFEKVQKHLHAGDTYLLNLTFSTQIETELTLNEIYNISKAKYKLFYNNEFVCFSPETFIKINDNEIFSFPMKGTIDASIPDAENIILNDFKETAEHNTIVDLIRNDLSIVAKEVKLSKYRFIDKITTSNKTLLQVSSEIKGKLSENWNENIGDILQKLLPAGSISGAPKKRTIEIIKDAENYDRGYYTGIFGIYDGENLDSAVAIRFIEDNDKGLFYKSGGGITVNSDIISEYNELQDKIYVPVN